MSAPYEELDLNMYGRTLRRSLVYTILGALVFSAVIVWFVQRPPTVASTRLQLAAATSTLGFALTPKREATEFSGPALRAAVAAKLGKKTLEVELPKAATTEGSPFVDLALDSTSGAEAKIELTTYISEYTDRRIPVLSKDLDTAIQETTDEISRFTKDVEAAPNQATDISRLSELRLVLTRLKATRIDPLVTVQVEPYTPLQTKVSLPLYPVILLFSGLIASAVAIAIESLRDRVRSANEVRKTTGLPVVLETASAVADVDDISRILRTPAQLASSLVDDLDTLQSGTPTVLTVSATQDRRRALAARVLQLHGLGVDLIGVALVDVKKVDRGAGPRSVV